ncbi:MAG: ABC transporter permease [Acidobacteria bacterium]|nr:ABC transporter permease [Acidobacteriota bacterium]
MRWYQTAATAASLAAASLRAHKLRSFLTLLGVIIGVSSVVIVGAAIEGLGNYAEETTAKAFGSESYQIGQLLQVGRLTRRERVERLKYNHRIRQEDYAYLKQETGGQILYSPYRRRSEDLRYRGQLLEGTSVIGASAALAEIRDVVITDGRFYTEQEEGNRVPAAVVGDEIREKFFPNSSPVGKSLDIANHQFVIVGVQEKIGGTGGDSQDNAVYIPATVFNRIYGPDRSMVLFARARPGAGLSLDEALDLSRVALRSRFKTRPGKPDNFDTITPDSIREFIGRIMGLIGAAVVPITCISLVVGGIVIMNIMLVSVTERTREIGVRRSLGARQSDLMLQFLLEAVFLSAMGGAVGLALGAAVAEVAALISGVRLPVTMPYVLLALVVSSAVGVVSGWYPARRAARLDPVEALRAD